MILKTHNLTKSFGSLKALHSVSLSVAPGDMLGIIGPNGAGKTTFFNIISGFIKATEGSVFFKKEEVTKSKSFILVRKGMARTFQIPKPFGGLSVIENLQVTENIERGRGKRVFSDEEVLRITGLWDLRNELARNLPIGFLKCLEMARALSTSPSLLLLDEPFAGLNNSEIDHISRMIVALNTDKNITIIIIEHKLRELMRLVKRVAVLHHGELIAEGSPHQVANNEEVLKAYIGKRTAKVLQGDS